MTSVLTSPGSARLTHSIARVTSLTLTRHLTIHWLRLTSCPRHAHCRRH